MRKIWPGTFILFLAGLGCAGGHPALGADSPYLRKITEVDSHQYLGQWQQESADRWVSRVREGNPAISLTRTKIGVWEHEFGDYDEFAATVKATDAAGAKLWEVPLGKFLLRGSSVWSREFFCRVADFRLPTHVLLVCGDAVNDGSVVAKFIEIGSGKVTETVLGTGLLTREQFVPFRDNVMVFSIARQGGSAVVGFDTVAGRRIFSHNLVADGELYGKAIFNVDAESGSLFVGAGRKVGKFDWRTGEFFWNREFPGLYSEITRIFGGYVYIVSGETEGGWVPGEARFRKLDIETGAESSLTFRGRYQDIRAIARDDRNEYWVITVFSADYPDAHWLVKFDLATGNSEWISANFGNDAEIRKMKDPRIAGDRIEVEVFLDYEEAPDRWHTFRFDAASGQEIQD